MSLTALSAVLFACMPSGSSDDGDSTSADSTSGLSASSTDLPTVATETGDLPTTTTTGEESGSGGEPGSTGLTEAVCGDQIVTFPEDCDGGPWCTLDCTAVHHFAVFHTGPVRADSLGGGVSGTAGADIACMLAAEEGGLPGRYKAWLSTTKTEPATRFAPAPGQYRLAHHENNYVVAASWEKLLAGEFGGSIQGDEHGVFYSGPQQKAEVWTGTGQDGRLAEPNCADWSSLQGEGVRGVATAHEAPDWTQYEPAVSPPLGNCRDAKFIYCFRQNEDCTLRACIADKATCEGFGLPPGCTGESCQDDPCGTCDALIDLCDTASAPCPVSRELCAELDEECGCGG